MSFVSVADAKTYTGIKPKDIGLASDVELDAWLAERLLEIDDIVNVYCGQLWDDDSVPLGVVTITLSIVRDVVMTVVASRETPIVQLGDYKARVLQMDILNDRTRKALDLYKVGESTLLPLWNTTFGMFRVRREDEMPEAI